MDLHSNRDKISVSWSGGKDSSLMLQQLFKKAQSDIVELHTQIDEDSERVGLHGIHRDLIQAQANSIGLPIKFIQTKASSNNGNYEKAMLEYYVDCKKRGIRQIAFGDIFLEDLKLYREGLLAKVGLSGYYPLWKKNTKSLASEFLKQKFSAIVCASDTNKFKGIATVGNLYNKEFLKSIPETIDPCGENGEFHSFTFNGPIFKKPIDIHLGKTVTHQYEYRDDSNQIHKTSFDFVEIEKSS